MDWYILAQFSAATLLLLVTPGPVMAMVTHNTLRHGASAGLMTAIAAETGKISLIGVLFAGLTIGGQVQAGFIRWLSLGAALYLVWRAGNTLRVRYQRLRERATAPSARPIIDGLTVGLGHPTALAFFAAFLPQFMAAGDTPAEPFFRLGASYLCTALIFDAALILALTCIRLPAAHARIGGYAELGSVAVYLVIATAAMVDFLSAAT